MQPTVLLRLSKPKTKRRSVKHASARMKHGRLEIACDMHKVWHAKKVEAKERFTHEQQVLLEKLAAGTLHQVANDATRRSGWGRIKHLDDTYEDITPHGGGIVRTVLDNVAEDTDVDRDDEDEQDVDWG